MPRAHGAGAWHGKAWFQVQWDSRSRDLSIAKKELLPIILTCDAWGSAWHGKQVVCHCDNQVVVACLRSRSSRSPGLMHLLRCLVFVEAQYNCFLLPTYIETSDLSRGRVCSRGRPSPITSPPPPSGPPAGRLDVASLAPTVRR